MKKLCAIAISALICSALPAFAGGGNHGGGGSVSISGGHHSSSAPAPAAATAVGPRFAGTGRGTAQGARPMSIYRPTVTYKNGQRTLTYPAVGISNAPRHAHSNLARNSNAATISQTGNLRANAGNQQFNGTNLRPGRNAQRAGALNLRSGNKLDPQSSARLRHWGGNVSNTTQAHQNHWNNCHHHHDHHWWHNHCAAFIFWDWGWWGWWDGWWYPAWGYDPYSYYGYNEPIYGYGDLSPEQIIASVQVALQQQGYYGYGIDGQMGPQTRAAIGQYQADHRLPVTYGIDPATLGSLGVMH